MGRDLTESVHPVCLETGARNILKDALQPWLTSSSALTLVLLAGEDAVADDTTAVCHLPSALDQIEQIALTCVRRTDRVVRCQATCCALVLLGAELEGALCVVNRLRRRMEGCSTEGYALLIGLAAAPEQTTEMDALITLACQASARLVPPKKGGDTTWDVVGSMELPDVMLLPRLKEHAPPSGRMIRRFDPGCQPSREPAMTANRHNLPREPGRSLPAVAFAQARARALGIPYLPPPHRIPSSVRNLLPQEVMEELRCLPIGRDRSSLTVALADPTDRGVLHQLEQITGMTIFPVMTDPDVLAELARPARPRRVSHLSSTPVSRSSR